MKIVSAVTHEPLVRLSSVAHGRVVRFQGFSYAECLTGTDQAACIRYHEKQFGEENY